MRIRWPFTIIWTAVCLLVVLNLAGTAFAPVSTDCRDMCGLDAALARFGIGLVISVWLVVTVVAAALWGWATRIRCPRCRQVVEPPVRLCPNCGYDLLQDVEPATGLQPTRRPDGRD